MFTSRRQDIVAIAFRADGPISAGVTWPDVVHAGVSERSGALYDGSLFRRGGRTPLFNERVHGGLAALHLLVLSLCLKIWIPNNFVPATIESA